ncbi:MAG TPA: DUF6264 family protein [Pseudolysinimonas sp.]
MSEPTPPVPRYGEYAPSGYVAPEPVQPYGAASYPPQPMTGRRRKTWDLVLTCVLLAVGLFGMLAGVGYGALFGDPVLLDQGFQQQGLDGFNGTVGAAPAILIISHVVLYLLALGVALPLLITRHVAFWAPLGAGVIAAIIFWATVVSVMLSDPAIVSQYS